MKSLNLKRFASLKLFLAAACLTLIYAGISFSVVGVPVLVQSQTGTWAIKATFAGAVAAPDTVGKAIWVVGYTPISADLVVPATRAVKTVFGGYFDIASGKTLDIRGPFDGSEGCLNGTGVVIFDPAKVPEVRPELWKMDGVADNVEIQKAIDSVKSTGKSINSATSPASNGKVVLATNKVYNCAGKIRIYPAMKFLGGGPATRLKAVTGFADPMIIELQYETSETRHSGTEIANMQFVADAGSGISAIMPGQAKVPGAYGLLTSNNSFHHLYFNLPKGLIFTAMDGRSRNICYFQDNDIDTLYSYGNVLDSILVFWGNANHIRNIDAEGAHVTTANPIIHLTTGYMSSVGITTGGTGNSFDHVIIENAGYDLKDLIKVEKGGRNIFRHTWLETKTQANAINAVATNGLYFVGAFRVPSSVPGKIKLRNSIDVKIERLNVAAGSADLCWHQKLLDMDTASHLVVDYVQGQFLVNAVPMLNNVVVKRIGSYAVADSNAGGSAAYAGLAPEADVDFPAYTNLVKNSGWRAGFYNWSVPGGSDTPSTLEFVQDSDGLGKVLHAKYASSTPGTTHYMDQLIPLPAGLIGKKLHFSMPVKIKNGDSNLYPSFVYAGMGASVVDLGPFRADSIYNNSPRYEDWIKIRLDITPSVTNAGQVLLRLKFNSVQPRTDFYVGAITLTPSESGYRRQEDMLSVGGNIITYAAAMPTTGEWTAGDIVYRRPQAAGQPIGWGRLTTGSGNVLNTDWKAMPLL